MQRFFQKRGFCQRYQSLKLSLIREICRLIGVFASFYFELPLSPWTQPGVIPPRSHMLLRVDLTEGSQIVDVGFGTAQTALLALEAESEQKTPHESFRLVPVDGEFDLEAVRLEGCA